MLLVFDIGNTNTVMGIYDGEKLVNQWRLTSKKQTSDEAGFMVLGLLSASGIAKENIKGAIFGLSLIHIFADGTTEGIRGRVGRR